MKKIVLVIISAVILSGMALGQIRDITETFDGLTQNSYGNYDYNGFHIDNGLCNSTNARSGNAVRLRNATSYLEYQGNDGNGKDGGVGTISFWYRSWDSSPAAIYDVKVNIDGAGWSIIGTQINTTSTVYAKWSYDLNDASDNILIRVERVSGERLHIDDFTITDFSGTGPDSPDAFDAAPVSSSEIDLSWTRNSNLDSVMVVWSPDQSIGTPEDGTYYAVGDTIPGGDSVIYRGTDTTYAHTALNSGTMYFYKAFSVDASTNYSTGTSDYATTYKDEPTNHVDSFEAGIPTALSIPLTWNDNDGAVPADSFLIKINTTGTFTAPVDGSPETNDLDVSDGEGQVKVNHGIQAYTWTNLNQGTHYYFTIYPFTNSGTAVDYKTDGTVPTADTSTTTANTNLIISEVADPGDYYNGRFVELYNVSSDTIFFSTDTWYLTKQANGGNFYDILLTDTIPPGEAYVIAYDSADFYASYGFYPVQDNGNINGNGDDGYFLYYGGDHSSGTLVDAYGVIDQDGTGKDWEYTDSKAVRKRSVGSPNSTWTASEWLISDADTVNMTPGQHFNYVTWEGNTDTDWNTKTNWDNGFIPDVSMDVTIDNGTNNPVVTVTNAVCWDITFAVGGNMTINPGGAVTVYNDLGTTKANRALYSLTIKSDATGQGSLIVKGSASFTAKVENYITTGQWHGISAPVSGLTANSLFLNGNPDVWMKYYNEDDNTYSYITDLGTSLGNMKGWMIWVDTLSGTLSDTTFTFEGALRSGTVSPTESIVRSQAGADYGYNFVGNPFTSTIDWDASSGWTKTNLENAIYVYNDTSFASYVGGTGTNGGSQYIAMNQGFFVQVTDDGSTSGTLEATSDVCVVNSATFMKSNSTKNDCSLVRLVVSDNGISDETVVKLIDGATEEFDGSYDAHKLFSFNTNYPQIFSTANGNMSINSLPVETGEVSLDVKGKNGDHMTINVTERINLNEVWLVDELTGIQTDLTQKSYTFTYDNTFSNRFTLHFSIVGVDENKTTDRTFTVYSSNQHVHVIIPENQRANIEIYNLLGQKVKEADNCSGTSTFTLPGHQYYLVRVSNSEITETQKVLIQ